MPGESDRPEKPQLRPVEVSRISHEGNDYFLLKDIQRISDQSLMVPVPLGLYLQGFDGTHTLSEAVESALANGAPAVPSEILDDLVERLDDLHLLSNGKYAGEVERQLED